MRFSIISNITSAFQSPKGHRLINLQACKFMVAAMWRAQHCNYKQVQYLLNKFSYLLQPTDPRVTLQYCKHVGPIQKDGGYCPIMFDPLWKNRKFCTDINHYSLMGLLTKGVYSKQEQDKEGMQDKEMQKHVIFKNQVPCYISKRFAFFCVVDMIPSPLLRTDTTQILYKLK